MKRSLQRLRLLFRISWEADRFLTVEQYLLAPLQPLTGVATAVILKRITQEVLAHRDSSAIKWGLGLALAQGLTMVIAVVYLRGTITFTERVRERFDRELVRLASSIPDIAHYENPKYFDELQLIRQQPQVLGNGPRSLANVLAGVIQAVVVAVLLFGVNPILVLLPLLAVPLIYATKRNEVIRNRVWDRTAERSRLAIHLFELGTSAAAAKEVRVMGLDRELINRHMSTSREVERATARVGIHAELLSTAGLLIATAGYTGGLFLVVDQAIRGRSSVGDVLLTVMLIRSIMQQIAVTTEFMGRLVGANRLMDRLVWLEDYAAERVQAMFPKNPGIVPETMTNGIDLEGIAFTYETAESQTLDDVTIHMPAGAVVAIVGDNGAGKTTLVKLLSRMYAPTRGSIRVDGIDIESLNVDAWRERLSAGFQDFMRFELLARNAVGIGDLPNLDDELRVVAALAQAGANELPAQLRDGLATPLGRSFDGGVELSGGQWQKLALGRTMMRDAPLLLVLDEPTSALDPIAEQALFERYAAFARTVGAATGTITILISHRFSTVRFADLIVVLDGGVVAEQGSHSDLMARDGLYAELFTLQARAYR